MRALPLILRGNNSTAGMSPQSRRLADRFRHRNSGDFRLLPRGPDVLYL